MVCRGDLVRGISNRLSALIRKPINLRCTDHFSLQHTLLNEIVKSVTSLFVAYRRFWLNVPGRREGFLSQSYVFQQLYVLIRWLWSGHCVTISGPVNKIRCGMYRFQIRKGSNAGIIKVAYKGVNVTLLVGNSFGRKDQAGSTPRPASGSLESNPMKSNVRTGQESPVPTAESPLNTTCSRGGEAA